MNKTIYVFWTEANELTPRRKNNLQILKDNCGVELKFLDHNTIQDYELPEHKFHKAYKYLSATAKSDYCRSYFMNFYGGAYCDIKRAEWDWNPYLMLESWHQLIGAGAMICKSKTPLTEYWFKSMTDILDNKHEQLKNNPAAHVRDRLNWTGTNSSYPLRWAEIGPETFFKSCFKYKDNVSQQLPSPALDEKYR